MRGMGTGVVATEGYGPWVKLGYALDDDARIRGDNGEHIRAQCKPRHAQREQSVTVTDAWPHAVSNNMEPTEHPQLSSAGITMGRAGAYGAVTDLVSTTLVVQKAAANWLTRSTNSGPLD